MMDLQKGKTQTNESDTLLCWGCGEHGQNTSTDTDDVGADLSHVTQLGDSQSNARIKLTACGSSHSIAVTCKSR